MYFLFKWITQFLVRMFFLEVEVSGLDNIPSKGPVIIAGNHKNQFVDAMIVSSQVPRTVSYIVAEKSMHRPIIGTAARWAKSVSVIRAQDRAFAGNGIIASNDSSSLSVKGIGTKFTDQVTAGCMLKLPGVEPIRVESVVSDTELTYSKNGEHEFDVSKTIETETKKQSSVGTGKNGNVQMIEGDSTPGLVYKIYPKVSQSEVFSKVHQALADGAAIGIFPEGGSSDRTDLLPLKAGVSVMAIGAAAKGTPVKVVPFGINYFAGYAFRSRVFVEVGEPINIEPELLERFNAGERKEVYAEFLSLVEERLRNVTFNAPDYRTMVIMRTMRRLYQGSIRLPFRKYMELNRRFVQAYNEFQDKEPLLSKLVNDVDDYLNECKAYGVRDVDVQTLPPLGGCSIFARAFFNLVFSYIAILLCLVIVIPNMIFNIPALVRVNVVVRREMHKALAGSSVKVKGLDVAASQKIITAAIWFPMTWIFETIVLAILLHFLWPSSQEIDIFSFAPGSDEAYVWDAIPWIWPVFFILTMLPVSIIAVRLLEFATKSRRLIPKYILIIGSLCRGTTSAGGNLREKRKELKIRVQDVFEHYIIPQIPRWAGDRIIERKQIEDNRRASEAKAGEQIRIMIKNHEQQGVSTETVNDSPASTSFSSPASPKNAQNNSIVPRTNSGEIVRVDSSAMRRSIRGSIQELTSVGETGLETPVEEP